MKIRVPLFIVFEGIDGSGKSTLAKKVHGIFSCHVPSVLLSEPTDGKWGRKIRELIKEPKGAEVSVLLDLFIRDRGGDVRKNILPALSQGKVVIMDRYMHSNAAYQGTDAISPREIIAMNLAKHFPLPHRVYLIDIDEKTALSRIYGRRNGMECFEKAETLHAIRKNYHSLVDETFCVLDGTKRPHILVEEVMQDIEHNFGL